MADALQSLLLTHHDSDWQTRLTAIHQAVRAATYFADGSAQDQTLTEILKQVKADGDAALSAYSAKFDQVTLTPDAFRITPEALATAHAAVDVDLMASIKQAIANVRNYQQAIFVGDKIDHPGVRYTPIERVGICVPGASAPLPSTVIMTAVPAQVGGVQEIVLVSPPRFAGSIHPVILAVCHELGIPEVYRIGGAHAVAALAYGTETIRPVHKIVGPGNQWVQMAKRKVFGQVDIDSIAGPSEVLIVANDQANPAWVAADMLSQAEHAPGSAVVLTDSERVGRETLTALIEQVQQLGRSEQTIACLEQFSAIIVCASMDQIIEQADAFASEHLEIQCGDTSDAIAMRIKNAGAMFIGPYTPVAVGDYWAGPSHTLPTGMTAKFFSPLSSNDFVKTTSLIRYDRETLAACADDIVRLAETEGLDAHAKSVSIRRSDS
ncbi:histidinol dehydrogenase [Planctomycetota bacterium]